jgi:hypothetical protein
MTYRLLSFEAAGGPRAGVLIGDVVHDAAALAGTDAYATVRGVLDDWSNADALFAAAAANPPAGGTPLGKVRLLAPILYPGQMWAAGANYQDHIGEMGDSEYKAVNAKTVAGGRPWHFSKTIRSAIVGPDTINPLPPYSSTVDWEIELAVVIGRTATPSPTTFPRGTMSRVRESRRSRRSAMTGCRTRGSTARARWGRGSCRRATSPIRTRSISSCGSTAS